MNIKQLKQLIVNLPDDMEIVGSGHYGEKLEIYSAKLGEVELGRFGYLGRIKALVIEMESAGDEPE